MGRLDGSFSELEMTIEDVAEVGERVVATVLQRGAGVGSGVEVEGRFWLVFTLVDGKIARLDAFNSERRALDPVKQLRPG